MRDDGDDGDDTDLPQQQRLCCHGYQDEDADSAAHDVDYD